MLDLFPFHDIKVSTKGLTKTGSYEIEEARPLAVRGVPLAGNPLSLCCVAVDVRVYPLVPALGWSFEKGNDESNFVHISSEGTPIIDKLGFDLIDESSQVLRVSLKRLNVKLVGPFLVTALPK
jgi:hypothetical protein